VNQTNHPRSGIFRRHRCHLTPMRMLWRLALRNFTDGQPGPTPGNVKLRLPPRQSRGISLCIRWFCDSLLSSDDARESGCILRLKLAKKGAASLEKDTAARPHAVVAQCIALSRGDNHTTRVFLRACDRPQISVSMRASASRRSEITSPFGTASQIGPRTSSAAPFLP
jgi:hypothetical protein